jgi:hypothetical protein
MPFELTVRMVRVAGIPQNHDSINSTIWLVCLARSEKVGAIFRQTIEGHGFRREIAA